MAYKDFIQALDKLLGYEYPSSYFILSSKLFHKVSIIFGFDSIEIDRGLSSTQIPYEELPNLQIIHTVKNGIFSTKSFLSLKSSKGIILEKIPSECEGDLKKIINLSKESSYSSRKQDIELFNTSNVRTFNVPLTTSGYSCIPYYNIFESFYSTEIGNKVLLDLLNTWYDDSDSYIEFLLEMIKLISEEGRIHFIGTGTSATFRIKKNWYIFTGSGYDTYSKNELDMYSEDDTKFYLANQNNPPEILSEFFESEVLICDDKITDNLLEYDEEIFNPSYEEDEYDDYDDSDEDDWDNDEESDSYEDSENDNFSDDDDESDDYDTDENDEDDDLSEIDQERIEREPEFASNIKRENELNRRIREDNPDLTITSDGSYPEYYNQKKRILIIGREDRGLDGADYNETVMEGYKTKKIGVNNGYKTPNAHTTHRRVLKYAKGLEDDLEYSDIENANDLADELGEKDGYSFAYINASKASNMKDNSQVLNKPQYDDFIDRNKKNGYLEKQMEILEPDIAVGMNLSDDTIDCLGKATKVSEEGSSTLYDIETENGEHYDFINLGSHLSSPFVNEEELYNEARKLSKKKK